MHGVLNAQRNSWHVKVPFYRQYKLLHDLIITKKKFLEKTFAVWIITNFLREKIILQFTNIAIFCGNKRLLFEPKLQKPQNFLPQIISSFKVMFLRNDSMHSSCIYRYATTAAAPVLLSNISKQMKLNRIEAL